MSKKIYKHLKGNKPEAMLMRSFSHWFESSTTHQTKKDANTLCIFFSFNTFPSPKV